MRLSPDFKGMDFHAALRDLKARIANYEAIYETLDESERDPRGNSISFIKVPARSHPRSRQAGTQGGGRRTRCRASRAGWVAGWGMRLLAPRERRCGAAARGTACEPADGLRPGCTISAGM